MAVFRKDICGQGISLSGARRTARLGLALRTSMTLQARQQQDLHGRRTRSFATLMGSNMANEAINIQSPRLNIKRWLFGLGTGLGLVLTVSVAPFFKNTREGMRAAWTWNQAGKRDANRLADAWAWLWIGIAGLFAGLSASRAILAKSIQRPNGSCFKIPLSVFGGVLGAQLTTSTAGPAADFVVFVGRVTEFTLDGITADLFGKPRKELAWVVEEERQALHEVKKDLNKLKRGVSSS